ncbi:serine hydrolase domain-containing protein [Rhodopila sp.]|uniref:serine hydrolase domain-containing protein n=1 Tax=Rhodopila sp. TaxID=2480087 RepID=UPI003D124B77
MIPDRLIDLPIGIASDPQAEDIERAMTLDTPFRVASNTKTFTAATVLRLAEERRIDLDDAIVDYLDEATCVCLRSGGFCCERITIRHLLAHSSGLADHTDDPSYPASAFEYPSRAWTRMEQVRIGVALAKPAGEPGAVYHYSDTGYVLLGEVIERVSRGGPRRVEFRTAWAPRNLVGGGGGAAYRCLAPTSSVRRRP